MVAGAVVISALASGCSATAERTTTPADRPAAGARTAKSPVPPTSAEPPSPAQLESALLRLSDLPPGWTAAPGTAVGSDTMPAFVACMGAPEADGERLEEVASPEFDDAAGGGRIHSMLTTFTTHERVVGDGALFGDPRAPSCLSQALHGGMSLDGTPSGASVGALEVTVRQGDGGGPDNVVAVATASIPGVAVTGRELVVHMDFVFLVGRSTRGVIAFGSIDGQLPVELRARVVATMAERVAAL